MPTDFIQYLLSEKAITEQEHEQLLQEYQKGEKSLDEALLASGKFDDEQLLKHKGTYYHMPTVALADHAIASEALSLFPKEIVNNYQIVPFAQEDDTVRVAMVDPQNLKAREAVDFIARQKGWNTQFYVTTALGLKYALDQYSGSLTSEVEEALEYTDRSKGEEEEKVPRTERELEEVIKSAPVSKMVSVILRHAVEGGASDIHIEPGDKESRVRYRIDGELHATLMLPKYIHASIVSRIKVMANLKLDETRKPQDGRIHLNLEKREIDFRVSTMPLTGSEKVVMRILDITRGAPTLEDLGFMGRNLDAIRRQLRQPNGMFLVTGPTGSGKSTTLFSALSILNKEQVNIVTLEDPVEYYLPGANQSQVRPEVGYTFATGLRSILRQDPDIIMVGEIRDNETAQLGIQAALTGHIVLSTLHTNDAIGAIPRLMDMKVEPFLLSSTLNLVQAQRLVRKICEDCKESVTLSPDLQKVVEKISQTIAPELWYEGIDPAKLTFSKGKGCSKCGNSGYRGRLSISEVIEGTANMQKIISQGFDHAIAQEELKKQQFISMIQDGLMKAAFGMTTIEEVVVATKE